MSDVQDDEELLLQQQREVARLDELQQGLEAALAEEREIAEQLLRLELEQQLSSAASCGDPDSEACVARSRAAEQLDRLRQEQARAAEGANELRRRGELSAATLEELARALRERRQVADAGEAQIEGFRPQPLELVGDLILRGRDGTLAALPQLNAVGDVDWRSGMLALRLSGGVAIRAPVGAASARDALADVQAIGGTAKLDLSGQLYVLRSDFGALVGAEVGAANVSAKFDTAGGSASEQFGVVPVTGRAAVLAKFFVLTYEVTAHFTMGAGAPGSLRHRLDRSTAQKVRLLAALRNSSEADGGGAYYAQLTVLFVPRRDDPEVSFGIGKSFSLF